MKSQTEQVLDYLRAHPGATAQEVGNGCHPFVSNPRARMSDLRKQGYRIEKVDLGGRKTGFVVKGVQSVTTGIQEALAL